eukprot:scaffold8520_cov248-Pinguiococcus_pyrenoidosus.AAC.4
MLKRIANRRREILWNRRAQSRSNSWEAQDDGKEPQASSLVDDGQVTPRRTAREESLFSRLPLEDKKPDVDGSKGKKRSLATAIDSFEAKSAKVLSLCSQDLADKERIALQVLCGVFSLSAADL